VYWNSFSLASEDQYLVVYALIDMVIKKILETIRGEDA